MAKDITLLGANYPDVPAVDLPKTGGGTARFVDQDTKKDLQTAVSDPTASGTSVTFIATLSQNEQGVISATKKTVQSASQSESGLMSATDKTKLDGVATGATANVGTITGVTMNGASKGTSGDVDLGTVQAFTNELSGVDVNTITQDGYYGVIGVCTNTPSDYGVLTVKNYRQSSGNKYCVQTFEGLYGGSLTGVWHRASGANYGSWSAWVKVANISDIPDISGKQDKTDNSLNTTSKTVVGAINELDSELVKSARTNVEASTYDYNSSTGAQAVFNLFDDGEFAMCRVHFKSGFYCLCLLTRTDTNNGSMIIIPDYTSAPVFAAKVSGTWTLKTFTLT